MNLKQGTTKRGLVRAAVAMAAAWAWYNNDLQQAIGAFTVGEALTAWLGVKDPE